MLKELRHVGILVQDLERAVEKFRGVGLSCVETRENEKMGVRLAFLPAGDSALELISHTGPEPDNDVLVRVVRGQAGAINHLCFEVDDLEATIHEFEKAGAKLVEGCPRPGAHGRIAFFYPETTEGILIELCEV